MPALESPERSFADVSHVGLVIRNVDSGQLHSGLLYKLPEIEPRVIHLAFHHSLRDERAAAPFRWGEMALDEDNKLILAFFLAKLSHRPPLITYAFDFDGVCFDRETGEVLDAPAGKGLTCATFIAAVLRTYGYELIDIATWPDRVEDREWQAEILDVLADHADTDHVEAVRESVGAKRLRPDEAVGAALVSGWPVAFPKAREMADEIVEDLAAA